MLKSLRRTAVRWVKPKVSPAGWQRLRALGAVAAIRPETARASQDLRYLATYFGTDKWGYHRYATKYEAHLAHLRDQAFTLLEIGIGGYRDEGSGGASLRMWKAWFPRAMVLGLDIEDKSFVDEDRIRSFHGSQVDEPLLRRIVAGSENLQVVIDDGSHRPEHIRATFDILFPLLPDGGIYVIEDTQTSYWPSFGGSPDLDASDTTMALVKSLLDGLNWQEYTGRDHVPTYTQLHVVAVHCYHNLVFVEKGVNREGSRRAPERR